MPDPDLFIFGIVVIVLLLAMAIWKDRVNIKK